VVSERKRLESAIAAHERLRGVVDDQVIEIAIGSLRKRLAAPLVRDVVPSGQAARGDGRVDPDRGWPGSIWSAPSASRGHRRAHSDRSSTQLVDWRSSSRSSRTARAAGSAAELDQEQLVRLLAATDESTVARYGETLGVLGVDSPDETSAVNTSDGLHVLLRARIDVDESRIGR
jgi:hypothetical protein